MTTSVNASMTARYDRVAEGYRECWAPVLQPGGERMLDRVDGALPGLRAGDAVRVLDVGCGTGTQLLDAAVRWPGARITGLDASAGMLRLARQEADRLRAAGRQRGAEPAAAERERIDFIQAEADALPFPDATFDVLTSAFLLQLVPDRPAALHEMHRVLRPGGLAAQATWLQEREEQDWEPERLFDECLAELGIVRAERHEVRAGDFRSVRSAAREIRRAGFHAVAARGGVLDYVWTPESYATYKRISRERDVYDSLGPAMAERLASTFRARLDRLYEAEPSAFSFRPAFVTVLAWR